MPTLVLLRHGQSQWNLENRFTGWVDVDLTPEGEAQARKAGELLKAAGVTFDRAYTSVLTRAIRTGEMALEAAGQGELALVEAIVLGDRDPALLGRIQRQIAGPDRAGLDRGEGLVDMQPLGGDQLAALPGLGLSRFGEVHVHPAGEAVFEVPLALAVAQQDQDRHPGSVL